MSPVKRLTQDEFDALRIRMEPIGDETQPQRALRVGNEFPSDVITAYMYHKKTNGNYGLDTPTEIEVEPEHPVNDVPPVTQLSNKSRSTGERENDPPEIEPVPGKPGEFQQKDLFR